MELVFFHFISLIPILPITPVPQALLSHSQEQDNQWLAPCIIFPGKESFPWHWAAHPTWKTQSSFTLGKGFSCCCWKVCQHSGLNLCLKSHVLSLQWFPPSLLCSRDVLRAALMDCSSWRMLFPPELEARGTLETSAWQPLAGASPGSAELSVCHLKALRRV